MDINNGTGLGFLKHDINWNSLKYENMFVYIKQLFLRLTAPKKISKSKKLIQSTAASETGQELLQQEAQAMFHHVMFMLEVWGNPCYSLSTHSAGQEGSRE